MIVNFAARNLYQIRHKASGAPSNGHGRSAARAVSNFPGRKYCDRDSYAYILESQSGGRGIIEVLDLGQKKVVNQVDAGAEAVGLTVGPDNSALVVANTAGVLII